MYLVTFNHCPNVHKVAACPLLSAQVVEKNSGKCRNSLTEVEVDKEGWEEHEFHTYQSVFSWLIHVLSSTKIKPLFRSDF